MSLQVPLHAMTPQDALRILGSSVHGLSSAEAAKRLQGAGAWRTPSPKPTAALRVLVRQLANPFFFVLCSAAVVSWWSGDALEMWVIVAIVLVNTTLGFVQEFQADRAFFALQHYLPTSLTVRRDGVACTRVTDELVPGDVMVLRAGQNVFADGRVIDATHFSVSEAALSGESNPVEKTAGAVAAGAGVFDRVNMVYAGTSVITGEATVVVSAIGVQSEFGKIRTLTSDVVNQETPLERETRRLARLLTACICIVATGMFALAVSRGVDIVPALSLAAALAIAVIPEGLPMTLTVVLSAAMRRMLKRGVLVRHLVATETLGCVNVLCTDKTGTMTTGVMSVVEVRGFQGIVQKSEVLQGDIGRALGAVAAMHRAAGNGIFAGSATAGAITSYIGDTVQVFCQASLPFDSAYRFSACRVDESTTYVLGAPDGILPRLAALHEREPLHVLVEDMAARGLRVIVVGVCKVSGTLTPDAITSVRVLAVLGIEDPLRPSVPGAIALAERAGIRTVMMTGDHPETAKTIGAEAFDHRALTVMLGEEFAKRSASERLRAVLEVDVFARMLPEHKLLVVQALHAHGLRVAMTGDGVNDAPALKAADVGIAVGHATEVAKEASDLVLIDGDFGNIVRAVAEGRTVFTNVRNVTVFLLALGLVEVFCILASFAFGLPLPLSPLLILWLNMATDGVPGLFFAFEHTDLNAMQEPPRNAKDGIMSLPVRQFFLLAALSIIMVTSATFFILRTLQFSEIETRSATFLAIGALGMLFIFVAKSLRRSFFTNLADPSMLRFGACIGACLLFAPFSLPSLRETFGIAWPSWPTMGGIAAVLFVTIAVLDRIKRAMRFHGALDTSSR